MPTSSPFISVLICTYNRPEYIRQSVESVLSNSYSNFEIRISDDCSENTDLIKSQVRDYLGYENVFFYEQPQNLGWSENRNFLLDKSEGEYVLIIGDDDTLKPDALNTLEGYIGNFPSETVFGFGYDVVDENDRKVYSRSSPTRLKIGHENQYLLRELFLSDWVPFWLFHPLSICYSQEVASSFRYNSGAFIGDDYYFLYELVNSHKGIFVLPEVLFNWRKAQNPTEETEENISFDKLNDLAARSRIYDMMNDRNDLSERIHKIVNSSYYKNVFLCDNINECSDQIESQEDIDEMLASFVQPCETHLPPFYYTLKGYIRRSAKFLAYFGLAGFSEMTSTLIQRLKYRFLT